MRSSRLSSASAGLIAILLLTTACSSGASGGVVVSGAWARPAVSAAEPTAAYLTITNGSNQADTLLSVSSPAAQSIEMHQTSIDSSGMAGMASLDHVDVAAGATVTFEPGKMHLMVMGLTGPLAIGDALELDLVFEHAGTIVVHAQVRQG